MKSRISIALDYDNQSIIRIHHEKTDDVRDDMVGRFLETFNTSGYALFRFDGVTSGNSEAMIRPLAPKHFIDSSSIMVQQLVTYGGDDEKLQKDILLKLEQLRKFKNETPEQTL